MLKRQGFSLIEVVAALAIIGIAFVGILRMFAMTSKTNVFKERYLIAINLLQRKSEEIRCKPFNTDVTENGNSYFSFENYTFDVTQTVPSMGMESLKKVDVTVRWPISGGAMQETISFLVVNNE